MREQLVGEFREELHRIAAWWCRYGVDEVAGGFIGEMDLNNQPVESADKGLILNARILWFFSELYLFDGSASYRLMADRAFDYIHRHFLDTQHEGFFWSVDYRGALSCGRKQTCAQAFALYGLSAYLRVCNDAHVLQLVQRLFQLIENTHDDGQQGYLDAFDRQWQPLEDMRLTASDFNAPKTMTTHLHVLEAYTALYLAQPRRQVKEAVQRCLTYFYDFIIDHQASHLKICQDYDWSDLSSNYSFGHDIAASWLCWEATEIIGDAALAKKFQPVVMSLADAVLRDGVAGEGEVLDTYDFKTQTQSEERVWWVQAEALVGFYNAYRMSGNSKYWVAFENVWQFIKKYHVDSSNGEWHWLSLKDRPRFGECKVGFWKGPYHNGRAMMTLCKLMSKGTAQNVA